MSSRFQFVEDHRDAFGVKRLCRILQVSRSGFYRWLAGADARTERARADADLAEQIARIHTDSDGTYGVPRVTAELREAGKRVNHKRVERVMRKFHIVGLHLRKKVRTTIPEPSATPVPDLLRRDFTASSPNTRYVGDITYLPIGGGQFLYGHRVGPAFEASGGLVDRRSHAHIPGDRRAQGRRGRPRRRRATRGDLPQRQRGSICIEGVRPGLRRARRDQIARRGGHERGQRRRGELQRDDETRDAPGTEAVERRP